jgi:hypothetical protein
MVESRHTRRRFLEGGAGVAVGLALGRAGVLAGRAVAASGEGGPSVGELRLFAGNYAPKGWLACTGEAISKADHPDLFAAIGDPFGTEGDRVKLPDLRSRAAAGEGRGSGRRRLPGRRAGAGAGGGRVERPSVDPRPHVPHQHRTRART